MFNGFFGKRDKNAKSSSKDALDSRGLEVTEGGDPDTVWGMWDSALAEQDSRFPPDLLTTLPPVVPTNAPSGKDVLRASMDDAAHSALAFGNAPTEPMGLEELTQEQRKDVALQRIEFRHPRIATSIRTLWGHKECGVYINKLIMDGADGQGHARVGFNQDAVEAMLILSDIHDAQFGPSQQSGLSWS